MRNFESTDNSESTQLEQIESSLLSRLRENGPKGIAFAAALTATSIAASEADAFSMKQVQQINHGNEVIDTHNPSRYCDEIDEVLDANRIDRGDKNVNAVVVELGKDKNGRPAGYVIQYETNRNGKVQRFTAETTNYQDKRLRVNCD